MRRFISTILLWCFMLISASASHGISYEAASDANISQEVTVVESVSNTPAVLSLDDSDGKLDAQEDDCPCKKETGATKFVCGVTLAFSSNAATLNSPAMSKTRYALFKSVALQSFVDLLKRPPRTIL